MKMILITFLEEMEEGSRRRTRSRRQSTLEEEGSKVLALLVRQLFLASRDWSLARRIGSPDPRQLLEWRVVVHALEELSEMFADALQELNGQASSLPGPVAQSLATSLPQLKTRLKAVVEALMHPSLNHACEVFHLGDSVVLTAPSRPASRGKSRGTSSGYSPAHFVQRATACLDVLAGVAIDRAVAAGNESILVEVA
jgi:hypothetical protein